MGLLKKEAAKELHVNPGVLSNYVRDHMKDLSWPSHRLSVLSGREEEIKKLLKMGLTIKEAAKELRVGRSCLSSYFCIHMKGLSWPFRRYHALHGRDDEVRKLSEVYTQKEAAKKLGVSYGSLQTYVHHHMKNFSWPSKCWRKTK
jgi:predicted transcriptional regulator